MSRDVRTMLEDAAVDGAPLDVDDLRRRGRGIGRRRAALRATVAAVALVAGTVVTTTVVGDGAPRDVAVDPAPSGIDAALLEAHELGVPIVVDRVLLGAGEDPVALDQRTAPFTGSIAGAHDGSRALYSTNADPSGRETEESVAVAVREVDLQTGAERMVVDGALGAALRPDGAIATVAGGPWVVGEANYEGDLVVLQDGVREAWSDEPASWRARAWVDGRLVAERSHLGDGGSVDLAVVVFDAPGQPRTIGREGLNQLVDVDPEGRWALLRHESADRPPEGVPGSLHLVDLTTGEVVDEWRADHGWVVPEGAWRHGRAVVPLARAATDPGGPSTDLEVIELEVTAEGFGAVRVLDPGIAADDDMTVARVEDVAPTPDGGVLLAVGRMREGEGGSGMPPEHADVDLRHCTDTCRSLTTAQEIRILP